jgi:hypothetical protein
MVQLKDRRHFGASRAPGWPGVSLCACLRERENALSPFTVFLGADRGREREGSGGSNPMRKRCVFDQHDHQLSIATLWLSPITPLRYLSFDVGWKEQHFGRREERQSGGVVLPAFRIGAKLGTRSDNPPTLPGR